MSKDRRALHRPSPHQTALARDAARADLAVSSKDLDDHGTLQNDLATCSGELREDLAASSRDLDDPETLQNDLGSCQEEPGEDLAASSEDLDDTDTQDSTSGSDQAELRVDLAVSSKDLVSPDMLENALRSDQEELDRERAADKRLRVQAVQAVFELMGVDHFDEIKKMVWDYLDQPPVWQFLGDASWTDCDAATQTTLNEAERSGMSAICVQIRAWHIDFSLVDMVQINLSTGKSRPLRRFSPWSFARQLPRWQYQTRFGWTDCDIEMQRLLGSAVLEAEVEGESVVCRQVRSIIYMFDFARLTQTNTSTGRMRALRYELPA